MQEAVFVNNLSSKFGSLVISEHHVGAFGENFTVAGEREFSAFDGGSYGAEHLDAVSRIVYSNYGRSLGHTVALVALYIGCCEAAKDTGLDRTAARNHLHFLLSAQIVAPFAVDKLVENPAAKLVDGLLVVVVVVVCEFPGAAIDESFDAFQAGAGCFQLAIQKFKNPRDSAEPVCVAVFEVCGESAHLRIIDADAFLLIVIVHRALVGVAERQERNHLVLLAQILAYSVAVRVEHQVVVAQHHAFRLAGRS